MTDQDRIRELIASYALLLDAGDTAACVQLFTEDGEFEVYGATRTGHDGIGAMFEQAPRGMHLTGVSQIDVAGDTATARTQVLFVNAATHGIRLALYDDELVRVDGCWRFRRRRCQFITNTGLSDTPQELQQ
jgi:uncharacterized protein (TIGR02246 family)